jgi:hypothetical protein
MRAQDRKAQAQLAAEQAKASSQRQASAGPVESAALVLAPTPYSKGYQERRRRPQLPRGRCLHAAEPAQQDAVRHSLSVTSPKTNATTGGTIDGILDPTTTRNLSAGVMWKQTS